MLCQEIRKSKDVQWSRDFYVLLHRDEKNDISFHLCEGRLSFCRGMTKELLQFISFLRAEEQLKNLPAVKREGWKAGAHRLLLMSGEQTKRASNTLLRAGLQLWAMAVGSLLPTCQEEELALGFGHQTLAV